MDAPRRNWSAEEVEAIVADYFDMLLLELQGQSFNKSEHRRKLSESLNHRSNGSIEFKYANISAAFIEMGIPPVEGYKPRSNYQRNVIPRIIVEYLRNNSSVVEFLEQDSAADVDVPYVEDLLAAQEQPPDPEKKPHRLIRDEARHYFPLSINYVEREQRNQRLGEAGEKFVLEFERARLSSAGKENLADKIEQVSETEGPSAGFDIHSYEVNGRDRFIEAKTTKGSKRTPFYISTNECRFSERHSEQYYLYRVFSFSRGPRLFTLQGSVYSTCALDPYQFRATAR